jgi:small subunit ribosomal protein S20
MPNNRNAAKAARQNEKRRLRNRAAKTNLKTAVRKVREAVNGGDPASLQAALQNAAKRLDQAASKKYIHKNKASRLKSKLAALANSRPAAGSN